MTLHRNDLVLLQFILYDESPIIVNATVQEGLSKTVQFKGEEAAQLAKKLYELLTEIGILP